MSEIWDVSDAPSFNGYSGEFAILYNGNSESIKASLASEAAQNKDYSFSYASPADALPEESRRWFNLDSIAGNGYDISRMKNVHDNIRCKCVKREGWWMGNN